MRNPTQLLIDILKAEGEVGLLRERLNALAELSTTEFEDAVMVLWNTGRFTGIRAEGCCGRGCGMMCVSYQEPKKRWAVRV